MAEEVKEEKKDKLKPLSEDEMKGAVKEELGQKTPVQIMEEWFRDPAHKKILLDIAKQIDTKFHSNWFNGNQFMKKTKWNTPDSCLEMLNSLKLGGFLEAKMFGKPGKMEERYHIYFTKDHQIGLIEANNEYLTEQIAEIKKLVVANKEEIKTIKIAIKEEKKK